MRIVSGSNLLVLVAALAVGPKAMAHQPPPPSVDWDSESETDDLPSFAQDELDWAGSDDDDDQGETRVYRVHSYGQDIPSPEDVVAGRRAAMPAPSRPVPVAETAPPSAAPGFDDFREPLNSHGRWVQTPEYGLVFVPQRQVEVTGWRPYLYGQWAWTSYGWTWVSEEPFGWATYHYGRWDFRAGLGWYWVPGYTWGPAWVAWRFGDAAIGWAPLYPGYVTYSSSYPYYGDHWVFIGGSHFYGHPVHRHWHRDRGDYYYSHSQWARSWRAGGRGAVYAGPPRTYVQRNSRGRIYESRIVPSSAPGRGSFSGRSHSSGGELHVYRPAARPVGRVQPGQPPARRVGSGLDRPNLPRSTSERLHPQSGGRGSGANRPNPPRSSGERPRPPIGPRGSVGGSSLNNGPSRSGFGERSNFEARKDRAPNPPRPASRDSSTGRPTPPARVERPTSAPRGNAPPPRSFERPSGGGAPAPSARPQVAPNRFQAPSGGGSSGGSAMRSAPAPSKGPSRSVSAPSRSGNDRHSVQPSGGNHRGH
ncbi:DUF6600 domain-containing protein [Vulgatibacter incomptus]|nr:DUF6600 domain-containing protein [Vulgatibacter incomptus]